MKNLTTTQLAEYLGLSKRTIQRRSVSEQWPFTTAKGIGGDRKVYTFADLPTAIKQKVISKIISKHEQLGEQFKQQLGKPSNTKGALELADNPFITLSKHCSDNWLVQHTFAHNLDQTELNKEYVKVGLLVMARLYVLSFSVGKIIGFDQFCQQYNNREFAINQAVYSVVANVSRITLLRWEKQLKQQGALNSLIDESNNKVFIERDIREMAQELLMTTPDISAKRLRQHFLTIFGNRNIPSVGIFSQWLKQQKLLANQ